MLLYFTFTNVEHWSSLGYYQSKVSNHERLCCNFNVNDIFNTENKFLTNAVHEILSDYSNQIFNFYNEDTHEI